MQRPNSSSPLYRASRFYVVPRPRARRLWTRYQTAPAVIGGYALLGFFLLLVGFVLFVEVCRYFRVPLRHLLFSLVGVVHHFHL